MSGAIVGIAVFLVFQAVYPTGTPSPAALAAASFVLGLQEKRFFGWIKQVGEAIIAVPPKALTEIKQTDENGPVN